MEEIVAGAFERTPAPQQPNPYWTQPPPTFEPVPDLVSQKVRPGFSIFSVWQWLASFLIKFHHLVDSEVGKTGGSGGFLCADSKLVIQTRSRMHFLLLFFGDAIICTRPTAGKWFGGWSEFVCFFTVVSAGEPLHCLRKDEWHPLLATATAAQVALQQGSNAITVSSPKATTASQPVVPNRCASPCEWSPPCQISPKIGPSNTLQSDSIFAIIQKK